jgi:predicted RNase H-like nuclease
VRHFARNRGDKVGARAVEIEQTGGKSIPPVTFGIMPKIDEVDLVMSAREPDASLEVREIHPELCFWALNYGRPLDFRKHTAEGIEERICVLSKKGEEPRAKRILVEAWSKYQNNCVGKDDILDSLVAAVTAYRGWPGELQTLPEAPQEDARGLRMEMVFWQPQARR